MNQPLSRLVLAILALLLLIPCGVNARSKPEVISHDGNYANRAVRIRVAWQSENPVVMVKIFAGREQKEIKVDEYDNRRTRLGYTGEVSAIVELDPSFTDESMAYVVQLEDDARLKSDQVTGKVQIVRAKKDDDDWGKDKLTSQPTIQTMTGQPTGQPTGGTTVEILDRAIGVMERYDMAPILGNITINRVSTDGVTITTKASDDKALSGVTFKIFDAAGNVVEQDSVTATGKSWEGTSKTFNLMNGNYKAVLQATDGTGNTSREKTQFFAITGSTLTSQPSSMGAPSTTVVTQPTVSEPSVVQTPEAQTPAAQTPASQPVQ